MVTKRSTTPATKSVFDAILAVLASILLIVTLFDVGFFAAGFGGTTRLLSTMFSKCDSVPYLDDDAKELAQSCRDYIFSDYGRTNGGNEAAHERFAQAEVDAAQRAAAQDSPKANSWNGQAGKVLEKANSQSATDTAKALANINENYTLSEDALGHLDDCYSLISQVSGKLWGINLAAVLLLLALFFTGRRHLAGMVLCIAPCALLAFLVICGIWGFIDFAGLFTVFHHLLFPQGNWAFPANSLLICLLPTNFWIGMGLVWICISALASLLSVFIGRRLIAMS